MSKLDKFLFIFYIVALILEIILAFMFKEFYHIIIAIWITTTIINFYRATMEKNFRDVRVETRDNFIKTLLKQNDIYRKRLDTQYNFEAKIRAIGYKAEVMDCYTLNNVIDDLNETLKELEKEDE